MGTAATPIRASSSLRQPDCSCDADPAAVAAGSPTSAGAAALLQLANLGSIRTLREPYVVSDLRGAAGEIAPTPGMTQSLREATLVMTRDDVLAICLELPAAEETHPFGDEVALMKIGGKMFAWCRYPRDPSPST